jgi:uncharacterized circularly permuted ATP-grasp superfamily protein/uncharacterized alpha-E superfamily protein
MTMVDQATLLSAYAATVQAGMGGGVAPYDEVGAFPGPAYPHWDDFLVALERFGREELLRRGDYAKRLVQENGITYNVYGDPRGMDRPWALDLIPFVIAPDDWAHISAGLEQRAHLLNLVVGDLYGEQRLLKEGVLPPEFLFANPKFLRSCQGLPAPNGGYVTLYGADLARDPSGTWMVLSDRTQTPSGMGYSLENRITMSRVYPNLIRDCRVLRLASFLDMLRGVLRGLAPQRRESPNVALLTPGPYNETYFEHAYLARYLGFTLAEGEDLTVRENEVYLKTVEGLQRVDVVFRRVDDDFCDPLDLRNDSTLGVVGLLQAIHQQQVAVSNMVGSGVLEVRALGACLPALSRYFLGEDLLLPAAATSWCALPEQRAYVEDHFDELYIGSAWNETPDAYVYVPELTQEARAALRARLRAQPHAFAALAPMTLATAPTWEDGTLVPRYVSTRTYTVTAGPGEHHVMPGGLTRFSRACDLRQLSMQHGSGSKDTWVRSEGPVDAYSLLPPPGHAITIRRSTDELPSRLADNLYWLGRYCERTEGVVRMLRYLVTRFTDESGMVSMPELLSILRAVQHLWPDPILPEGLSSAATVGKNTPLGHTPSAVGASSLVSPEDSLEIERKLIAAVFDIELPSSVIANLRSLQRTAWVVRDRFSQDDWRIIGGLNHPLFQQRPDGPAPGLAEALVVLNHLITGMAAFSGLTMENMTRERGWHFLDMGRRIERALHAVRLIDSACAEPILPEESTLQAVLIISDSPMTYRARYGANFRVSALLDVLLCDESNPRSLAFQMNAISKELRQLPHAQPRELLSEEERIIVRILAELRLADVHALGKLNEENRRPALKKLFKLILAELPRFSDLVAQRYFSHTGPVRRFSARQIEGTA